MCGERKHFEMQGRKKRPFTYLIFLVLFYLVLLFFTCTWLFRNFMLAITHLYYLIDSSSCISLSWAFWSIKDLHWSVASYFHSSTFLPLSFFSMTVYLLVFMYGCAWLFFHLKSDSLIFFLFMLLISAWISSRSCIPLIYSSPKICLHNIWHQTQYFCRVYQATLWCYCIDISIMIRIITNVIRQETPK